MNYAFFSLPRFSKNIYIVWYRNLLVWKKLLGPAIAMHFGEPLIYLFGMGFGLGFFVGEINEMPYLTFLAAGLIASSAMMTSSLEGTYSVFTRMVPQKTYSAILATPVEVDDIVAGEFLWCATKALFSGTAILVVATLLGAIPSWTAIGIVPLIFLSALCYAGPAIVIATFSRNYDFFNYYFTLAVTPQFVLCGVFYPINTLPDVVQAVVYFLPLTHAVELIRPLVAGTEVQNPLLHIAVIVLYIVIFYYIAVVRVRKRMIV